MLTKQFKQVSDLLKCKREAKKIKKIKCLKYFNFTQNQKLIFSP